MDNPSFKVNQFGDSPLFVANNTGVININIPSENNFEKIQSILETYSPIRHFSPSITPVIKRTQEDEIISWIEADADEDCPLRIGFIIGAPGIGKTALTNSIYSRLSDNSDYIVWGFKADQIRFEDVSDLESKMHLFMPLSEAIRICTDNKRRVVVIIDQIDALSLSLSSNRTPLTSLSLFIKDISKIPHVRIIVSCREFDINYDSTLSSLNEHHFRTLNWEIRKFSPDEVKHVLKDNNLNINLPDSSIDSLGNPQLLNLYLRINKLHPSSINESHPIDLNYLYDILWDEIILKNKVPHIQHDRLLKSIDNILDEMHLTQKISVPDTRIIAKYQAEISYLCSSGIFNHFDHQIHFTHQTWFEYAYARRFVEANKSLIDELKHKHQGLFIRSQVASVLLYLRTHDPKAYVNALNSILFDVTENGSQCIRFHLKALAISGLLYQQNPTKAETRLIHEILHRDKSLGVVVINAAHTPEWMDIILNWLRENCNWNNLHVDYRGAIINSLQNMAFSYCNYFFDIMKKLLPLFNEEEGEVFCRFIDIRTMNTSADNIFDFLKFIQGQFPGRLFLNLTTQIASEYPEFASQEILKSIESAAKECPNEWGSNIRPSHDLDIAFENIEKANADLALELCINALHNISLMTLWDIQLYKVKKTRIFNEYSRCSKSRIDYDTKEFLFNHIIDALEEKHRCGKEIWPYLDNLIHSDLEPSVYAALCVLEDYHNDFKNHIFELFCNENLFNESTAWVEYIVCEILRKVFPNLDEYQQKAVIEKILTVKDSNDTRLCFEKNKDVRMEHGIPLTYEGWRRGILLNVLPEETLKEKSTSAYHELQRLKRRFKHLENNRPISCSSHIGWSALPKDKTAKMSLTSWHSSMLKFTSDHQIDFQAPTLTGQANAFRDEVEENPEKFHQFILQIIDDEMVVMKYVISGFEGLLNANRFDLAKSVFEKLEQWIGADLNKKERGFSLHSLLFIITKVVPNKELPKWMFDFLCRIVLEKDDSADMDNYRDSDIATYSINQTRGNAAYNLVRCVGYEKYNNRIFEVLESIASSASISTRAAMLLNMALLNNIDKDRNLQLFKRIVHDFSPILMSLPVHNLNPLIYFINYGFDKLIDYFEKAVKTPEAYRPIAVLLWLAWRNNNINKAKELLDVVSSEKDAQIALLTFLNHQNIYNEFGMEYILKFLDDGEKSSELVHVYDLILTHFPVTNPAAEKLALGYMEFWEPTMESRGYIKFLKNLSRIKPRTTLLCVNKMLEESNYSSNTTNDITEILLSSYNGIKEYDDINLMPELERAMNLLDSLFENNSATKSMNQFIERLDND